MLVVAWGKENHMVAGQHGSTCEQHANERQRIYSEHSISFLVFHLETVPNVNRAYFSTQYLVSVVHTHVIPHVGAIDSPEFGLESHRGRVAVGCFVERRRNYPKSFACVRRFQISFVSTRYEKLVSFANDHTLLSSKRAVEPSERMFLAWQTNPIASF